MSKQKTDFTLKMASAFFAVVVVVCLFALQAISISGGTENSKPVKIYSMPVLQKQTKQEFKKNVSKDFSEKSVAIKKTMFAVEIPKFSHSIIEIETASLVQGEFGDFSVAAFQTAVNEDFSVEIFNVDMLDKTPKRLDTIAIEYPKRMLKLGVEGDVRLSVLILENGEVRVEKVLNSTNNFFSESAIVAASRFIYETPLRNGKPVKARFVLPIPFRIVK